MRWWGGACDGNQGAIVRRAWGGQFKTREPMGPADLHLMWHHVLFLPCFW